jgi:GNAT superfamily N-acetyltransferase
MLSLVDRLSNTGHAGFVNGTQVSRAEDRAAAVIRPVGQADLAALSDFFDRLSAETRYRRFFGPVTPTRALLDLLSGRAADVHAVVAVAGGVIVGHAMAADRAEAGDPRGPGRTCTADIGVVVADAWQGRGVGSALMRALVAQAQARGVTSLAMDVLHANRQVLAMIIGHWPEADVGYSADSLGIRVRLPRYRPPRPRALPAARPLVTIGG